jgi:hypothetical protein
LLVSAAAFVVAAGAAFNVDAKVLSIFSSNIDKLPGLYMFRRIPI